MFGAAIFAIIMAAVSLAGRRSQQKSAARSALADRLGEVVGATRWVLDQGSIDVLRVSSPDQLQSLWTTVRARMVELETRSSMHAAGVGDETLGRSLTDLGQSVAALRGAIESNVAIRIDPTAVQQSELLEQSTRAVYDRRQQLEAALAAVATASR